VALAKKPHSSSNLTDFHIMQNLSRAVILGCGYVGWAVARRWQSETELTVTTTTPERVLELQDFAQRVVVVKGNEPEGLRSLLSNQTVVLLSLGAPNRDAYQETYLHTAQTLVEVLPDLPTLQQVIYTSSYAVYGDRDGAWVDETIPVAPANPNGEILAKAEQVLLGAATDSLKVCVLRLGGIYGPGRELVKIFGRIAGTVRPGTGDDASNWVHRDDIAGAIAFAQQQQLNGIYNLVDSTPLTVKTLLDRVFTAENLPLVSWDASQPSSRPYNARVSNAKLCKAGYQFIHPEIT
jgi:nucleoside-diphosphate-sugar epimerase